MDHSPIRQTFELGKFISTAGKSIINLVKLCSLVVKCCKMRKIQSCEVCEFCILLYYARKSVTAFRNVLPLFRAYYKSTQNSQTSHDCICHILRYFSTKLHNFTKFRMLFPAVLMNFPNSKVFIIGEWPIVRGGRIQVNLNVFFRRGEHRSPRIRYEISSCAIRRVRRASRRANQRSISSMAARSNPL